MDRSTKKNSVTLSTANVKTHTMKHTFFVLLVALLGVLSSCKKGGFTKFDIDYEASVVIQNGTGVSVPFSILTPDIESNSESEFEVNDTRKDKIQEISLTAMRLEIVSPSGQEFDFLQDIELFISADGLDEIILAYIYDIDDSVGNVINISCSGSDFQEYIKKDKFKLRVRTVSDEYNLSDVEIKIYSTFNVDAKLIGKA